MTREPEWDDESRERATRLHEYEHSVCTCGCGLPREVARDPQQAFRVDTFTCVAGRAIAKQRRAVGETHKDDPDDSWSDGLYFYAEPVDLDLPLPTRTSRLDAIKARGTR